MQNWILLLLFIGSFYFGKSQILPTNAVKTSAVSSYIYVEKAIPCFETHLCDFTFERKSEQAANVLFFKNEAYSCK